VRCASLVASASASLPSSQKERGGEAARGEAGRRRRRRGSGGFGPGREEAWAGWGGG